MYCFFFFKFVELFINITAPIMETAEQNGVERHVLQ